MRRMRKIATATAALALAVTLTACDETESSADKEAEARGSSYDQLVANQPARTMTYSPARETINDWVETWSEPGKLSYTYFLNADGEAWGYYVLQGLPSSYCAMLTPNYDILGNSSAGYTIAPAPGIDGTYSSGAQCDTFFGIDATTGTQVQWTAGLGVSTMTYEEPQSFPGARALGPTEEDDVTE